MSDRVQQLTLPMARKAVMQADAGRLGVVSAYARLQLARAAANAGELAEGLSCALEAAPGLAVAAELADPGQILRWQGRPVEAWHGLSQSSRDLGDKRAYLDGGVHVVSQAIVLANQGRGEYLGKATEEFLHRASLAADRYAWILEGDRWPVILAVLPRILRGVALLPRELSEVAKGEGNVDVAMWSLLDGAFDDKHSLPQQYGDALACVMSLAMGGVSYRPLRAAVLEALCDRWLHFMHIYEEQFDGAEGCVKHVQTLREDCIAGDLRATASVLEALGAAVIFQIPWQAQSWLKTPFEGLASSIPQEE